MHAHHHITNLMARLQRHHGGVLVPRERAAVLAHRTPARVRRCAALHLVQREAQDALRRRIGCSDGA